MAHWLPCAIGIWCVRPAVGMSGLVDAGATEPHPPDTLLAAVGRALCFRAHNRTDHSRVRRVRGQIRRVGAVAWRMAQRAGAVPCVWRAGPPRLAPQPIPAPAPPDRPTPDRAVGADLSPTGGGPHPSPLCPAQTFGPHGMAGCLDTLAGRAGVHESACDTPDQQESSPCLSNLWSTTAAGAPAASMTGAAAAARILPELAGGDPGPAPRSATAPQLPRARTGSVTCAQLNPSWRVQRHHAHHLED